MPVSVYLSSLRDDIVCIVCDGSDQPDRVRQVLAPWLSDKRLRIVDNTVQTMGQIPSMAVNWSRALDAADGRWITVIGDDDVLDPALLDFLVLMEQKAPYLQAISWSEIQFDIGLQGADGEPRLMPAKLPMKWETVSFDTLATLKQELSWPRENRPPGIVLSVYHGAIRRELLENIREERNGSWFHFQCVDYDLGWALATRLKQAVKTMRPFSINGHSPKSNSYSIGKLSSRKERAEQWLQENKSNGGIDGWNATKMEPYFKAGIDPVFFFVLPVALYGFRQDFIDATGFTEIPLNKGNFVQTLIRDAQGQADKDSFEWYMRNLKIFLSIWLSQAVDLSTINWFGGVREPLFVGLHGDTLLFDRRLVDGDLARFAALAFRMVPPPAFIL